MDEAIQYIEELLRTNECVIIPGLGGFVAVSVEARMQKEEHLFLPPHKEISFNLSLRHDDELLLSMWVERQKLTKSEARLKMQTVVGEMWRELTANRQLQLGKIGRIYYNERSEICFESMVDEFFFPDYFGLQPFRCLEWRYLEDAAAYSSSEKEVQKEYIHIRIPRYHLRQWMVGAAIMLVLMLISKPVETSVTDYASLIPSACQTQVAVRETPVVQIVPVVSDLETEITPSSSEKTESVQEEVSAKHTETIVSSPSVQSKTVVESVKEPEKTVKKPANKRTYYIVIGSVTTAKEAQELIVKQKAKGYVETASITCDGRIRVYVKHFADRAEAEAYLNTFRDKNPQQADAWLFSYLNR